MFQLLVVCARFLLRLIVISLFTTIYEAFLQKELFACARWAKPEAALCNPWLKNPFTP